MTRCVSRLFILNGTSDDVERMGDDEVTGRAGARLAREARRGFPYIFGCMSFIDIKVSSNSKHSKSQTRALLIFY